jgi:hypothetical protein
MSNLLVHYRVYKIPPLVHIQSQMSAVHNSTSNSFKIQFNIIISLLPGLQSGLFPSEFPTKISEFVSHLFHSCHVPNPSHPPRIIAAVLFSEV